MGRKYEIKMFRRVHINQINESPQLEEYLKDQLRKSLMYALEESGLVTFKKQHVDLGENKGGTLISIVIDLDKEPLKEYLPKVDEEERGE